MKVGIFFFRPTLGGGTTTFTAHLFKALEAAGAEPMILRIGEKDNEKPRQFGKYEGVNYIKVGPQSARRYVKDMPTVMGSPASNKYLPEPDMIVSLMKLGMRTVIHDPNEFTIYDHLGRAVKLPTRPICIRPTMKRFYPDALWIPHPYHFTDEFKAPKKRELAGSIARIASVKRPRLLLDANIALPKSKRIQLRGAEYRMYTYNLQKIYPPEIFKQCGGTFQFPMTFEAPVEMAANYQLNFDMTLFPDDGGGTQYAQMEAMNAGTVNIMHEDWWRLDKEFRGEMRPGKHVLTVSGTPDIIKLLKNPPSADQCAEINAHCAVLLKKHSPKIIGQTYLKEIAS